jgi:hypothetical protein
LSREFLTESEYRPLVVTGRRISRVYGCRFR